MAQVKSTGPLRIFGNIWRQASFIFTDEEREAPCLCRVRDDVKCPAEDLAPTSPVLDLRCGFEAPSAYGYGHKDLGSLVCVWSDSFIY